MHTVSVDAWMQLFCSAGFVWFISLKFCETTRAAHTWLCTRLHNREDLKLCAKLHQIQIKGCRRVAARHGSRLTGRLYFLLRWWSDLQDVQLIRGGLITLPLPEGAALRLVLIVYLLSACCWTHTYWRLQSGRPSMHLQMLLIQHVLFHKAVRAAKSSSLSGQLSTECF